MINRVLLIDSDAQVARLISWILEGEGFQVVAPEDPAGAAEAAAAAPLCLILLDCDGIGDEQRATIRELKRQLAIPLVETGYRVTEPVAGEATDAVLRKPFAADDLVACVRRLTGRSA
jgi:DNA-binding response OmpR family regulator